MVVLIPSRDNKTQLVRLKTAKGIVLRPLQRIYPLEMTCADDLDLSLISQKCDLPRKNEEKEPVKIKENDKYKVIVIKLQLLMCIGTKKRKVKHVAEFKDD